MQKDKLNILMRILRIFKYKNFILYKSKVIFIYFHVYNWHLKLKYIFMYILY